MFEVEPRQKSRRHFLPMPTHRGTRSTSRRVSLSKRSSHVTLAKKRHPVLRCAVFKQKTPTQTAKIILEYKLCFSCLNDNHSFRKCSNSRKCTKDRWTSHNTLLRGAERICPNRPKPGEQCKSLNNSSESSNQKPREGNSSLN